ncbi:MAG: response regulator transcription factor [Anaerolineae bacterium]|nr:response regulator transcription factor [Anaerolineae bacterium]
MRVLLIEDDYRLAPLIKQVLEDENMQVDIAADGELGLEYGLSGSYDVAVVDWMLPGRDGPSICRALRGAQIPIGILMLTARGQVEDRVTGLNMGADDYLVKPFSFDELIARVEAVGRRHQTAQSNLGELRIGDIVMDIKTHTARRGNDPLDLTKTEWGILEYMLRHPDQVLTRENILDYVWSHDRQVQTTMVDVYISYLRNKLNQPKRTNPIETVRGVGYRLVSKDA